MQWQCSGMLVSLDRKDALNLIKQNVLSPYYVDDNLIGTGKERDKDE